MDTKMLLILGGVAAAGAYVLLNKKKVSAPPPALVASLDAQIASTQGALAMATAQSVSDSSQAAAIGPLTLQLSQLLQQKVAIGG